MEICAQPIIVFWSAILVATVPLPLILKCLQCHHHLLRQLSFPISPIKIHPLILSNDRR